MKFFENIIDDSLTSSKDALNKVKKDVQDIESGVDRISGSSKGMVNTTSIIGRARNSVLQFPVYISKSSMRDNQAHVFAKTFERVYATLVQTVLSHNSSFTSEEVKELKFLKSFHTNLTESVNKFLNEFYEPHDDFDKMMLEGLQRTIHINENVSVVFNVAPCPAELIKENARLMHEPLQGFKQFFENIDKEKLDFEKEKETQRKKERAEDRADRAEKEKVRQSEREEDLKRKDEEGEKSSNKAVDVPKLLNDAAIKKVNGMLPYTIEASFRITDEKRDVKFIIGIKTVLHMIDSKDLADDLREIISGNIKKLQKVRYQTGELNFKDYWFNLKGLKADAAKHINYNKRWLNTLKRLGEYRKLHGTLLNAPAKLLSGGHVPIPNGTLVLGISDVDLLKSRSGVDIENVSIAKKMASSLFLIAIAIVDSTAGTMRVLFPDSDSDWDTQSLGSLEAEVAKVDNAEFAKELQKAFNVRS